MPTCKDYRAAWQTVPSRTSSAGKQVESRFACLRVVMAHAVRRNHARPRWEWLIIEWPEGEDEPSAYWLSNLPADTEPQRVARLARLRWTPASKGRPRRARATSPRNRGRSWSS